MSNAPSPDLVEQASPVPFEATVERLARAITDHGMTIFARIDHAAQARDVGLSLPPTTVLIYGNAKGGTPIMSATPQAALDLPLRVLIREQEDGTAMVAFHPIAAMLRCAGVPESSAVRLEPAQQLLLAALTL